MGLPPRPDSEREAERELPEQNSEASGNLPPPPPALPPPPPPEDAGSSLQAGFDAPRSSSLDRGGGEILDGLKPRWQRTREDETQYFAVSTQCLGCGADCQVTADALYAIIRCQNCGTIMHLDHTGVCKLGVPSKLLKRKSRKAGSPTKVRERRFQPPLRFPWPRSRVVQIGFVATLVALLILAGLWLFRPTQAELPATLRGRAETLCRAILDGDAETLQRLTTRDTLADARQWFDEARRNAAGRASTFPRIRLNVVSQSKARQAAVVTAAFEFARNDANTETMAIVLHWKLENGKWLLDGTRTLKQNK